MGNAKHGVGSFAAAGVHIEAILFIELEEDFMCIGAAGEQGCEHIGERIIPADGETCGFCLPAEVIASLPYAFQPGIKPSLFINIGEHGIELVHDSHGRGKGGLPALHVGEGVLKFEIAANFAPALVN